MWTSQRGHSQKPTIPSELLLAQTMNTEAGSLSSTVNLPEKLTLGISHGNTPAGPTTD